MMFTFATLTSKISSTAILTCVLLARIYVKSIFILTIASEDFSVITGRLRTSLASIIRAPPQLFRGDSVIITLSR